MAPGANLMLVEARSNSLTDLFSAISYANSHGATVVSMSWGGGEFSGETSYDSTYFSQPGVTYVASSGDSGAGAQYPAASPNVVGVGGTTLRVNSSGNWSSETGWNGSGGGPSAYEARPSYQQNVQSSSKREVPDVAYDASPATGYYIVYNGALYSGVGGTSAGAPQWAAIFALANQDRQLSHLGNLGSTPGSSVADLYNLSSSDFHDITIGANGAYRAGTGYDMVTGRGSPIVNLLVPGLDGPGFNIVVGTPAAPSTATTTAPGKASPHDFSAAAGPVAGTPAQGPFATLLAASVSTTSLQTAVVDGTDPHALAVAVLGLQANPAQGIGSAGTTSTPGTAAGDLSFNSLGVTYFNNSAGSLGSTPVGSHAVLDDDVGPDLAEQFLITGQDGSAADVETDNPDTVPAEVGGEAVATID
jgi:subtilase family serine protease